MMNRLALATALGLAAMGCGHASQSSQNMRLAYVDYQRILLEVEDAKAAKARLQKWIDENEQEISREQELLRKEKEQLDKQASVMSEEARSQKAADLQKRVLELGQKWERLRAEVGTRERQELDPIIRRIDKVVEEVADRGGFALVFDRSNSGLVYGRKKYDLSDEVIRALAAKGAPRM
jgi:outer membrane protein